MSAPNNVHADGLTVSVASASANEHDVEALNIEVAWQDRVLEERAAPKSFLLFQDPSLAGSGAITSTTSELGPFLSLIHI